MRPGRALETGRARLYTYRLDTPTGMGAMCESTVFLKEGSREKVLMKEVAAVRPRGGKLLLVGVLGEQLEVEGVVTELDLMGHRIVVESPSGGGRR